MKSKVLSGMFGLMLTFALILTGCDSGGGDNDNGNGGDEPFVAVTGITDAPSTATVGTPLTLTGTVTPNNATNKAIVWTVKSPGATGATISGNTLTVTAAGTVTVTATIANGKAQGEAFTRDFTITVTGGGNGNGGGGSFSISGEPIYRSVINGTNLNSGERYSGQKLELTGKNTVNSSATSIENVGSISADGKLTLNLPADPPANALADASTMGVSAKLFVLYTSPSRVFLANGTTYLVYLIYADQDASASNILPALKKGWQYIKIPANGAATNIADPIGEGYKWVVAQQLGGPVIETNLTIGGCAYIDKETGNGYKHYLLSITYNEALAILKQSLGDPMPGYSLRQNSGLANQAWNNDRVIFEETEQDYRLCRRVSERWEAVGWSKTN